MAKSIGVFLVHSYDVVRDELCRALGRYEGIEIVGQSTSVESALAHVAQLAPAVIIMESVIQQSSSPEVVPEFTISISRDQAGKSLVNVTGFRERGQPGEVAIVGRYNERRVQVMNMGPEGYRFRDDKQEELVNAVVSAAQGEIAFNDTDALAAPDFKSALDQLQGVVRNSDKPTLQIADGIELRDRSNGHTNGASNGHTPVANNGHADEPANGSGNHQVVTQNGRAEHVTEGWFGPVTIREAVRPEEETANSPSSIESLKEDLPEGTEIRDNPTIHWETSEWDEQAKSEESDDAWMNIWQAPRRHEGDAKEAPADVELVLPPDVDAPNLYKFILRLKQATKGEVRESRGSIQGTSVMILVHRATPLLNILRAMPEVVDVSTEGTGQYESSREWGSQVSAEHLPRKFHIELRLDKEEASKQLKLALQF